MTGFVVAIVVIAAGVFWALRHHERFITMRKSHELLGWWYGGEFVPREAVHAILNDVKPLIEVRSDPNMPPGTLLFGDLEHAARHFILLPDEMTFEAVPMDETKVIQFVAEQRMRLRVERPDIAIDRYGWIVQ